MIPLFKVAMGSDVIDPLAKVLRSGYVGEGSVVTEFENALQEKLFLPSVPLTTNSCTSAIQLVLLSLGVGPGDEVITTPMTCIASNAPILMLGANPVWADVDSLTGNIDPYTIYKLINRRTKAIIAVDWTGRRCNYKQLKSFGLPVIEDAAHGPYIDINNCGNFVCFSFGPIKHLTSGDGGAIYLSDDNPRLYEEMRLRRWYGLDRTSKEDFRCSQGIDLLGSKFHMNNINASIGLSNLSFLYDLVSKHRSNAERIHSGLENKLIFKAPFDPKSDYWVFPIMTVKRDQLIDYLGNNGITASRVHARNDKHPRYLGNRGILHCTSYFDDQQLNVPCGWWMTEADVDHVIQTLNKWRP